MQRFGRTLLRFTAWLLAVVIYFSAMVVGYAVLSGAIWPEASGTNVQTNGNLTIDASNSASGYVMVRATSSNNAYKVRVTKDGATLMYDINSRGEFDVFPLQLGSGNYSFELFRNVSGNKFAAEGALKISAQLDVEYAAFLVTNQYVNYTEESPGVLLSDELLSDLETDEEKLQAVREYVVSNFTYDNDKARTVAAGTMPDMEYLLENKKGICQDIAELVACMLRVQGIPTQLVIGYANQYYHAWNMVLLNDQWQLVDLTAELNAAYSGVKYTVERYY